MVPPPILLIHGASLNRRMWDPAVEILGAEFTVSTIDLPGHGHAGDRPFRIDQAVGEIVDSLRQSAPDGAVLAGDSLGGYVGMAVVGAEPGLVAGLVACGCTGDFRGGGAIAAKAGAWLDGVMISVLGPDRVMKRIRERVVSVYPRAPLQAILDGGVRPAGRVEALRELAGHDFRTPLERYSGPMLVVNGESDKPMRSGEATFLRRFPRARLEVVPGSPHGVSLWDPPLFARIIGSFVREIR